MAAPVITCPACTKKFKGKEGIVGKRIKCPLCSTPFVVNEAALQAKPKEGAPFQLKQEDSSTARAAQRVSWNKEDDDSNPYTLGEYDDRPRCPNCANLLEHEKAIICLFCGYNNQTRSWGTTVRTMGVTGGQHFAHLLPGIVFLLMLFLFAFGIVFFAIQVPPMLVNTWASFLDHESMRMWINLILLAFMWVFGTIAFRRLILRPKPKEREKEPAEK